MRPRIGSAPRPASRRRARPPGPPRASLRRTLARGLQRGASGVRRTPVHRRRPAAVEGCGSAGPEPGRPAERLRAAVATAGAGQTVAIVDAYDDPNAEADLARLPHAVRPAGLHHRERLLPQGQPDAAARTLPARQHRLGRGDLARPRHGRRRSARTARSCSSRRLATASRTSAPAVTAAAALGANAISNSYGGGEYSDRDDATTPHYNHPGIAITASSGDSGYGVEFPAASQYVTAVGGTTPRRATPARAAGPRPCGAAPAAAARLRRQAGVAERHRLREAHGRRRLRGRRPDHRRRGLRHATAAVGGWLVFGGTSVVRADHRERLRARRQRRPASTTARTRTRHTRALFDVTSAAATAAAAASLPVHRRRRLRRPDRPRHAERHRRLLTPRNQLLVGLNQLFRWGPRARHAHSVARGRRGR